jgi:hypothetical protein
MNDPLPEIKARRAVADLPWTVKTDTTDGPEIHDAYNEVARVEVPHAVWECDDELDGCPDNRRESIKRAQFIAHAPTDIDTLIGEVERLREQRGALWWARDTQRRAKEVERLRGALRSVLNHIGPHGAPPNCENDCKGCRAEMHEACRIAREALGVSPDPSEGEQP